MNNHPRWMSLTVVYLAILTIVMILLYIINSWLKLDWQVLAVIGLLGSGLIAYKFSDKIF